MTFEEFFKKKKIYLPALEKAEGELFFEFKEHYDLMGEKSFDHTKKYWFNKLRRLFPLPPEIKVEKVIMENRMAEQTINETLSEPAGTTEKKPGFTPRFKAGASSQKNPEQAEQTDKPDTADEAVPPTKPANVGFKPRFKAGQTTAKTDLPSTEQKEQPAEDVSAKQPEQETQDSEAPVQAALKPGFKPRFRAGLTGTPKEEKPEEEQPQTAAEEPAASAAPEQVEEHKPEETSQPIAKPGFKPRFKPGLTKKTSDVPPAQMDEKDSATATPEVNRAVEDHEKATGRNTQINFEQVNADFTEEKQKAQEEFGSPERVTTALTPKEELNDKMNFIDPDREAKPKYKPRFKPPQK